MATRRRTVTRRRNPILVNTAAVRTALKECESVVMYALHEITAATVMGEGNPTKAELMKLNKMQKGLLKLYRTLDATNKVLK